MTWQLRGIGGTGRVLVVGWLAPVLCGLVIGRPASAAESGDAPPAQPAAQTKPKLKSIAIETSAAEAKGPLTLRGRDATRQLVVTGVDVNDQTLDMTRQCRYRAEPEGVVEIADDGWVTPLKEGAATIHVSTDAGPSASVAVKVENLVEDVPVNFPNDVVPVFTKLGCNGGGCHGKSGGQNGFSLSLLGFEPREDYRHLVKEARGRRVFPAAPDRSLLLLKATGATPHGGGARLESGSPTYRVLRRWIAQGMPYGRDDAPKVARIEVLPRERLMKPKSQQQIAVLAHYSDGSVRDVTRMAQYESNDKAIAESTINGLVSTDTAPGSAAMMARYQSQVDVFRSTVPLGAPVGTLPKPSSFVDEIVFAKLVRLGIPPSQVCDDATFLRRVTIDIAGRLPTGKEAQEFLASQDPDKRNQWIDRLLDSPGYADYFANKWSAILRNRRGGGNEDKFATFAFHHWIRQSFNTNMPYDQFVRGVIAASGDATRSPGVTWYHQVKGLSDQVEDTAQVFLGMRIQCARCHHHPFEKWSEQDYYGMAAFFSRVGRKGSELRGRDSIFHNPGVAGAANPKTGKTVPPTGLGAEPSKIAPEDDPRHRLVDWMTKPDNPFFARALVNRYWKHFLGKGLVEPEDDMRMTNPPSHPKLLDAMANQFVQSKFDLKDLVRTICRSKTYQLSAEPNEHNGKDQRNFSRFYPRRLNAEVLLDAIDGVTRSPTRFSGVPVGTRAVQLPDNAFNSYFLTVFGRPDSASACECERSIDATLAQSLHLLNSNEILAKIVGPRAHELSQDKKRPHAERIRELYFAAFGREPSGEEREIAEQYIKVKGKNGSQDKLAYEDLIWVLINTKEFMFNH